MSKLDTETQGKLVEFGLTLAAQALERRAGKRLAEQTATEVIAGIRELEEQRVVKSTDELLDSAGDDNA